MSGTSTAAVSFWYGVVLHLWCGVVLHHWCGVVLHHWCGVVLHHWCGLVLHHWCSTTPHQNGKAAVIVPDISLVFAKLIQVESILSKFPLPTV